MNIGGRFFDTDHETYIMGILNVTPDSFSDGGRWNKLDDALRHAERMIAEGAAVIDVGGESTRPGYEQVSEEEEIDRIVPVIEHIKSRFDIAISADTYKSAVARAAAEAGADMINDIWGLRRERDMADLIADRGLSCCLMHNRGRAEHGDPMQYRSLMEDVLSELGESLLIAEQAGIEKDRILVDPGVGFAKSCEQNLAVIRQVGRLRELGVPVLLGTSRKSVIGLTLDLPVEERLEGTLASTVYAVCQGCSFVRVHDVEANRRVIQMTRAILAAV